LTTCLPDFWAFIEFFMVFSRSFRKFLFFAFCDSIFEG